MASSLKSKGKRPHPLDDTPSKHKSAKRTKLSKPSKSLNPHKTSRHAIPLDKLKWKSASLPDRLEDAEGFYGLEEIDDVEVVKNEEKGIVEFRVKTEQTDITNEQEHVTADEDAEEEDTDANYEEEEEWSGIEDSEEEAVTKDSTNHVNTDPPSTDSLTKKKEPKAKAKEGQPRVVSKSSISSKDENVFELLQDNEDADNGADVSAWRSLNLSARTLSSLSNLKFSAPTSIQSLAIPVILAGHDVIGKASTGSGKTLAFGIPILEHYLENHGGDVENAEEKDTAVESNITSLILSPTRELAHQLKDHLTALFADPLADQSPRIATLTGGLSLQKQRRLLKRADVVIGTPGRLWEVITEEKGLSKRLLGIKYLVIDEADRLLSEGHFKEVESILNVLERKDDDIEANPAAESPESDSESSNSDAEIQEKKSVRQTLVFSATFSKELHQSLSRRSKQSNSNLLNSTESLQYLLQKLSFKHPPPKFIDASPTTQLAAQLKEGIITCATMEKDLYLYATILLQNLQKSINSECNRTLIFTNSISSVRRLVPLLQSLHLPALPLHSSMAQKARLRSLERFAVPQQNPQTSSSSSILVATDVAARGLDIPEISTIIHYHLPRTADAYIHRSGRTARATASGESILLCAPEEVTPLRRLVGKVHSKSANKFGSKRAIHTVTIDRLVIDRLQPRVVLAQKITDTTVAKEKHKSEDNFLRKAAEDLGVDYSSDEFMDMQTKKRGRGGGRKKREAAAAGTDKGEIRAMKWQLEALLKKRVNLGISERYVAGGVVDMEKLVNGIGDSGFLGGVDGLSWN